MNIFSAVALLILSMIGAMSLLRELSLRLFRSEGERSLMIVTFPEDDPERVEAQLRSAISRLRWGRSHRLFVCAACERDSEAYRICKAICGRYGVSLIDRDTLLELLREKNETPERK